MSSLVDDLLSKYPIISDQIEIDELRIILSNLELVIDTGIQGDVVEFGCYSGTTSLFIQRLLQAKNSSKRLWVYDSFDGLPEKTKEDESPLGVEFRRGELRSTKAQLIQNFRKAQLILPRITKKWFHEVLEEELPEKICFAFLDGDYYKSIRSSIGLVTPRISAGGVIVIDDYDNPALPGAKLAVRDAGVKITDTKHSLGIVK